ncbi:MAG: 16S rRNA (guanine(527)-N(7))-methyltransferase RsmG [Tabrizicola sp.]|nr:16S rRNA (guanine(527)-N(7))-methyltransferase RsmG [Tabrizicola sp.]
MTDQEELSVAGINVSRETLAALRGFEQLVRRWTPAINLVSKSTLQDFWNRHIVDSAQVFSHYPPSARQWVDLGSGGGFPGLVVAILARELQPSLRVVLVEADLRKATFLRQAVQELRLQAEVRSDRIESLQPLAADVLSARALAPLSELLAFADQHLLPDGVAIFQKGSRYNEELVAAIKSWDFEVEVQQSLSEPSAAILVIRKIKRAKHA